MLALAALATQFLIQQTIDPAEHASPSGACMLLVDPSAPDGSGPASYRLTRDGALAWEAELDFTLREAAVTDDGIGVGYALTNGPDHGGHLVIAVIGPDGEPILDERVERSGVRFMHTPDDPFPLGLVVDQEHDRFAVRMRDADLNRGVESWRRYRISTGEELEPIEPASADDVGEGQRSWVLGARAVRGTGLLVVHWWLHDYPRAGAVFTLMDFDGDVVWRAELPLDYTAADGETKEELRRTMHDRGAILESSAPGAFRLWFVRDGQAVTFRAERSAESKSGWRVAEVGRDPYAGPAEPEEEAPPGRSLAALGSVELAGAVAPPSPLASLRAWTCAQPGGFLAVRENADGSFDEIRVSRAGVVYSERRLGPLPNGAEWVTTWCALDGGNWLVALAERGAPTNLRFAKTDIRTGSLEPLPEYETPTSDGIAPGLDAFAAFPDGGFAALVTFSYPYSPTSALLAFDAAGRPTWSVWESLDDPTKLFAPEDLTITPDGHVVVVETVVPTLKVYARDGTHVRTIDLAASWTREPRYPSAVTNGPDNSVLVRDVDRPALWHMDLEGALLRSFTPHFDDGREPGALAQSARFGPDGSLWAHDDSTFLRLRDDGAVVERAGEPPDAQRVNQPGLGGIVRGLVCVQDQASATLFAWNEAGEPALVGAALLQDAERVDTIPRFASAPDGSIWVSTEEDGYLGWDERGRRLGLRGEEDELLRFAPDPARPWTWSAPRYGRYACVVLRDAQGTEHARIERRPDGGWIRGLRDLAIADDGTLAVLTHTDVLLYDAEGEPLGTIDVQDGAGHALEAGGDWIVVSSWRPHVLLLRRSTGESFTFAPPFDSRLDGFAYGLSTDAKRLLCLEPRTLVLHRFELPEVPK